MPGRPRPAARSANPGAPLCGFSGGGPPLSASRVPRWTAPWVRNRSPLSRTTGGTSLAFWLPLCVSRKMRMPNRRTAESQDHTPGAQRCRMVTSTARSMRGGGAERTVVLGHGEATWWMAVPTPAAAPRPATQPPERRALLPDWVWIHWRTTVAGGPLVPRVSTWCPGVIPSRGQPTTRASTLAANRSRTPVASR